MKGLPVSRIAVEEPFMLPSEEEVVELSLLLPGWQATLLETEAHQRGLTAAAMVRHVLRDFLDHNTGSSSPGFSLNNSELP